MNKRMILMLLGVGILFGGIFGFKAFVNTMIADFFDNMPMPTATITAGEAREIPWTRELEAVGSFTAVQGAMLTSEVGGIVREIRFENGARVEAGQVLLVLDDETDQARLRSLEAAQRLADLELQRARRLASQNNISEAELTRRESDAEQAVAAVNEQRARIRQKSVRAPFSGELGIRLVNVGQYLSPGDPVVSLQSVDPIYLDFSLPERRIGEIRREQTVNVHVDALGRDVQGKVNAIEPAVSASTRTLRVQATVNNDDDSLRPGMFGRVRLEIGEAENRVVVAQSAISFSPYGNSVYVISEDEEGRLTVNRRFVQTGERRGDLVVVTDGLSAGDRVATSGLLKLRNGSVVEISDDEAVQPRQSLEPRPDNA
jgi:membrane fusion protein (multidrug efflux system)